MKSTMDLSEKGLETLIVNHLRNVNDFEEASNFDYDRKYALDLTRLFRFLKETQNEKLEALAIKDGSIEKENFLARLSNQILDKGTALLLRKGMKYKHLHFDLYMPLPSVYNERSKQMYSKNIFSVSRQLAYTEEVSKKALDMAVFINGLPIMTFELKNSYTHQNYRNAIEQYKNYRSSKEILFRFKKCFAHFAVCDSEVWMCSKLDDKKSIFLPFNKGNDGGAGNPVNPNGLKTDYLWKEILTKNILSIITERFVQIVDEVNSKTKNKKQKQIFPRYHQLYLVMNLLEDSKKDGVGKRYLIQHSAGSGKSNSIAWLAHQLTELRNDEDKKVFDSIIVVTDRVNLDKQIRNTIKQFMEVSSTVGWAKDSKTLRNLLEKGTAVIITIVHKFQFLLDTISSDLKTKKFAIIIDEAHSSQNGSLASKMNIVLSGTEEESEDIEDKIIALIAGKKMASNASYYAFTATPKNKTLELFGKPMTDYLGNPILNEDGTRSFTAHYTYTMKQAIEEGYILDVLKNYTTYSSYYKIIKTSEDDPEFDKKKSQKLLRTFVESNEYAISKKATVIVDHFHNVVCKKMGGLARAMVVAKDIKRAIEYYYAIDSEMKKRKSPYKAVIAFSGEKEYGGKILTESVINGFASNEIESKFKLDPYRILVVANKFQTGYDEPLLQTMYVDKILTDVKAVQTLSRLNRFYPGKSEVFVLDFANKSEDIAKAFDTYYKGTILSGETDINKLNDLTDRLDEFEIYNEESVNEFIEIFLKEDYRSKIDKIIDTCVEKFKELDLDDRIEFKSSAKSFVRTYNFLSVLMEDSKTYWEKLGIFLTNLLAKLPKVKTEDFSYELYSNIDLDSYRLQVKENKSIYLTNADSELKPLPVQTAVGIPVPDLDKLSNILDEFHKVWGSVEFTNTDRVIDDIKEIQEEVKEYEKYRNAIRGSDEQNAKDELSKIINEIISGRVTSNVEIYKAFHEEKKNYLNQSFNTWLIDLVFNATYDAIKKEVARQ
ncbi:type I restriction endonuclease subunit R [Gemella sp. zg-1178]|uniref:type I restriction endonuclease subunit R n=1 Tax=Gemella sp. zg-1178 TaxID=2840372 RepID=UPI001C053C71|nr:type I restriction endonuclease [Gemella sp. zg-1178]MBU0279125.1 DEAD/DEAH box helicase family protein [Gemella sp. zg-1178]